MATGLLASFSNGPFVPLEKGGGAVFGWMAFLPSAEALGPPLAFAYAAATFLVLLGLAGLALAFRLALSRLENPLRQAPSRFSADGLKASLSMNLGYIVFVPLFPIFMSRWLLDCYREPPLCRKAELDESST